MTSDPSNLNQAASGDNRNEHTIRDDLSLSSPRCSSSNEGLICFFILFVQYESKLIFFKDNPICLESDHDNLINDETPNPRKKSSAFGGPSRKARQFRYS